LFTFYEGYFKLGVAEDISLLELADEELKIAENVFVDLVLQYSISGDSSDTSFNVDTLIPFKVTVTIESVHPIFHFLPCIIEALCAFALYHR
jgi:hypothetical protein